MFQRVCVHVGGQREGANPLRFFFLCDRQLAVRSGVAAMAVQFTNDDTRGTPCVDVPLRPAGYRQSLTVGPVCPPRRGPVTVTGQLGSGGVGFAYACMYARILHGVCGRGMEGKRGGSVPSPV